MSACGQCGFALEEGADACGRCGAPADTPKPAGPAQKWGTLIRVPRAATAPLVAPAAQLPPLTAAGPNVDHEAPDGPSLELDAPAPAPRARPVSRAQSAPLGQPPARAQTAPLDARAGQRPARAQTAPLGGQPARAPNARAPSGPLAQGQHPAMRGMTAPVGQGQHPATRGMSTPRHPAVRGPSVSLGQAARPGRAQSAPIGQPVARPPSGPIAMHMPPSAAGEPANANHMDTGLLEIGDGFSTGLDAGPALEMASLQPQPPRRESPRPQPQQAQPRGARAQPTAGTARAKEEAPRESNAEQRMRRVRDLARYPTVPEKLLGAVPYFWRVYTRRREIDAQVAKLAQQRKRLEIASDEALCALGQALYAQRADPELKPLLHHMRVVNESAQDVGAKAAAAKRTEQELNQELASVERELLDAQAEADPVQARDVVLSKTVDEYKAQIKRREMLIRKGDAELSALKASAEPEAMERIATLMAEREQHHGEIQSYHVYLLPLEEELEQVRAKLAQFHVQIDGLQSRVRRLQGTLGREHEREKIAAGGSHSAFRDALRSLANAALRAELTAGVPAEQRASLEASEVAAAHRESEELMRAAASCYDVRMYQRGMQLLVGGTIGAFVLFVALIVF